jgi:hypothetical protein
METAAGFPFVLVHGLAENQYSSKPELNTLSTPSNNPLLGNTYLPAYLK